MPHLTVNGATLYYEESGAGPETIIFAHGLLWSGSMFREQVKALRHRYRCITFDFRGQGKSEVTTTGYDMDTLTEDAIELIEKLADGPVHFLGLSMGGFVGMRLALRRPELLRSLMLLETSADPEPPENVPKYKRLVRVVRWFGLGLVTNRVMPIMFGQTFLNDPAREKLKREWRDRLVANHRNGIVRATNGVIGREGVYEEIANIHLPTLILVGEEDTATVPAKAERIQAQISGAELHRLPGAGHTSTVETPERVNQHLLRFLERVGTQS